MVGLNWLMGLCIKPQHDEAQQFASLSTLSAQQPLFCLAPLKVREYTDDAHGCHTMIWYCDSLQTEDSWNKNLLMGLLSAAKMLNIYHASPGGAPFSYFDFFMSEENCNSTARLYVPAASYTLKY